MMVVPPQGTYVEDPGQPDVPELLQREPVYPAVPVKMEGAVTAHQLPAKRGPAFTQDLSTTFQHVIGADLKRKRMLLISTVAWLYRTSTTGVGVPWPANVPLELTHADHVYAAVPTSTGTLTVITEVWAD